jgi:hypothetical protein
VARYPGSSFPQNGARPHNGSRGATYDRPATHRAATPARWTGAARRARLADRSGWHWLLLGPVVLPLLTPLYNRIEPTLFGFPFFYWFQLALAGLSSIFIGTVYLITRKRA